MDDEHIDTERKLEFFSNLYKCSEDNYFQSTPRKTLRTASRSSASFGAIDNGE